MRRDFIQMKDDWDEEENNRRARKGEVFRHPSNPNGETLCGRMKRPHLMKRHGPMYTGCTYPGCNGQI